MGEHGVQRLPLRVHVRHILHTYELNVRYRVQGHESGEGTAPRSNSAANTQTAATWKRTCASCSATQRTRTNLPSGSTASPPRSPLPATRYHEQRCERWIGRCGSSSVDAYHQQGCIKVISRKWKAISPSHPRRGMISRRTARVNALGHLPRRRRPRSSRGSWRGSWWPWRHPRPSAARGAPPERTQRTHREDRDVDTIAISFTRESRVEG